MSYDWNNLVLKTLEKDENQEYWSELNIDDNYSCSCRIDKDGNIISAYINEKTRGATIESLKDIPEQLKEFVKSNLPKQ